MGRRRSYRLGRRHGHRLRFCRLLLRLQGGRHDNQFVHDIANAGRLASQIHDQLHLLGRGHLTRIGRHSLLYGEVNVKGFQFAGGLLGLDGERDFLADLLISPLFSRGDEMRSLGRRRLVLRCDVGDHDHVADHVTDARGLLGRVQRQL